MILPHDYEIRWNFIFHFIFLYTPFQTSYSGMQKSLIFFSVSFGFFSFIKIDEFLIFFYNFRVTCFIDGIYHTSIKVFLATCNNRKCVIQQILIITQRIIYLHLNV